MAIVINGSGTVTGLAVGGLPDGTVDSGTIATGTIVDADVANVAASKLTGALPAISGASLTGVAGRKNFIINGNFQVSQRGTYTSATALTSSSVYHLDRFASKIGTISGTLTHKTDQTVNGKVTDTMLLTATSTATGKAETKQPIEEQQMFKSQTVTFSAWVKSNTTNARLVLHQNGPNIQTNSNAHTGGGSFELLQGTVTLASNSNDIYLYAGIQAAGTGNVSISNGNYFEMAFVQLEFGSVATDFENRSYGEELALCQRYYEIVADASQSSDNTIHYVCGGFSTKSDQINWNYFFQVVKRATFTLEATTGTDYYKAVNHSNSIVDTAVGMTADYQGLNSVNGYITGSFSGSTEGKAWQFTLNNANAKIAVSAEL